jgi:hypothetical protein
VRAPLDQWMWVLLLLAMTATAPVMAAGEASVDRWTHIESVPGGTACAVRTTGGEVDTMLMLNQSWQLILVAGRADWSASGSLEITLRIDEFEMDHLHASALNNLVMLQISDDAVLKRLKTAKDIYWYLPSGKYHAEVSGMDDAIEWLHRCEGGKHPHARGGGL